MEMIVCVDLNWGIGSENNLLFRLKTDMEFFKNVTRRKTLLMGRKTYESLSVKPLPNRRNVVLSSTQKYTSIRNLEYITSIDKAIEKYNCSHRLYIKIQENKGYLGRRACDG